MLDSVESLVFGFCPREKGYDSIQFGPSEGESPMGTYGFVGLTEIALTFIDGKWDCGVADASRTPFRAGWMASQQCGCQNVAIADTCGILPGVPSGAPFSSIGATPPLCKVQGLDPTRPCDPATCRLTTCSVIQGHP